MNPRFHLLFITSLLLAGSFSGMQAISQESTASSSLSPEHHAPPFHRKDYPYHKHHPKQDPPSTLDPEQFKNSPESYVAYFLAAKMRSLLYQQPCLCPCGKELGHKSLLDCFTGLHGRNCGECKLQVFFCYEQSKKSWSAKQIRDAIFHFKFLKIDFEEYTRVQWRALTEKK